MVPRRPRKEKENNLDTDSEYYSEDDQQEFPFNDEDAGEAEDGAIEEEFHTDPEDESSDDDTIDAAKKSSYLPAHLLNPSTTSATPRPHIPPEQLSKKQRRRRRNEITRDLRRATRGSGVLEAGEAAQVRRGVVGGRVEKAGKKRKRARRAKRRDEVMGKVSGKQKFIEERRALRELSGGVRKKVKRE
ncbi:hypothetical protein Tdes44962_MAKER02856 [Teratosphaeria destructans]|uniref:Uncharacterized protein n=1 Tax=Teratosphaeria destructans TaxID=418781 RepID=A0A9W7W2H5_9PEZI|nr:hypothetical protein Tdes44962_MAKER02856 [Teratosphaeria destructans]